jgi:glycine/D-amino acid oxidase-like deaminating enzyme
VTPDVAVVGGGIVGCATAAFLAAAGASVVLFEQTEIAAGASGRNSGVVQHPFDDVLVGLYRRSLGLYRDLAATMPDDFRLGEEPAGLLLIGRAAARDEAARIAKAWAATYPEARPDLVAGDALLSLEPSLAPDLVACRLDIGYPVVPGSATRAYAALAQRLGAKIVTGAATLATDSGSATGVDVDGRLVAAGSVVVAAGPWTPEVVSGREGPAGSAAWPPIGRSWGVVATVSLERAPGHALEEIDIDIEPDEGSGSVGDGQEGGFGFSLVTAAGSSSLGSTFLPEPPKPSDVLDRIRDRGARYVPAIATASITATRTCARPITRDGRPLIGPIPGIRNAFVAAGNGPWGISTGPGSARLVADLVLGRTETVPAPLDPGRFARDG